MILAFSGSTGLTAALVVAGLGLFPQQSAASELLSISRQPSIPTTSQIDGSQYILGPGDQLQVELIGVPELRSVTTIGPDGTIYLPSLRSLYVEGLTIDQLTYFLADQYKIFVKSPEVFVRPISYRSVRVYIGGEVSRPGYYELGNGSGYNSNNSSVNESADPLINPVASTSWASQPLKAESSSPSGFTRWPKLFDALQAASGVTAYSDLSKVRVIRNLPASAGGEKIETHLNFMRLVDEGDENVNIRLFDGDTIIIARSENVSRERLIRTSRSNLSPTYIQVFVSGRVFEPGLKLLPQGSTLNQALASAGGPRLLRGGVEFLRFDPAGNFEKRQFSVSQKAEAGSYKNPVLMSGDIVRIKESIFSASVGVLNEVTGPAVGIYSIYSLLAPR